MCYLSLQKALTIESSQYKTETQLDLETLSGVIKEQAKTIELLKKADENHENIIATLVEEVASLKENKCASISSKLFICSFIPCIILTSNQIFENDMKFIFSEFGVHNV